MTPRVLVAAAVSMVLAATGAAQSLASRVAAVKDGTLRLTYAARPGVLGNGHDVIQWDCGSRTCGQRSDGNRRNEPDVEWSSACDSGPVRLTIRMREGAVSDLRVAVGGRWIPRSDVTDLGAAPAAEAARYLLTLARQADGHLGGHAIFAATLADSVTVWPDLLRLARDVTLATETRRQAVFWVSQAAGSAATKGLGDLVGEDTVDRTVREQAVFALSQRPRDEGVPALIRIAKTHRDPEIRRRAIFWLGQSNDPRALALFEELLAGP
jgi:HEAT repeats